MNRRNTIPGTIFLIIAWALSGCATHALSSAWMSPEAKQAEARRLVDRAVLALQRGDRGRADGFLREATHLMESIGGGRGEIAQRLIEQGRPEAAVAWLEPLTRNAKSAQDPLAWGILAKAATRAGSPRPEVEKRAQELADALLKTAGQPTRSPAERARQFLHLGLFYLEDKNHSAEAIRAFREAVRLARRPETLNALGYTLADQGESEKDFEEAVTLTRQAIEMAPGNGVILDSFGWALYRRGDRLNRNEDLIGARRVLREAVEQAPDVPEIRYHLAIVYNRLGLTREAALELDRALRLRPGFPEAVQARSLLRLRWGV